ncbi:MAG: Release factor glutamine methyltransferase [Acidobacteriaceae bacterium]|nr:Release factor glutamine methyltransferase [Acidobacteriaceae bacterium]
MFALRCDRAYLYGHPERELTRDEESIYKNALVQRSKGIPAQYITGHQEFWGMDLIVSPAVLIPRPETEHVVEEVLARISTGRVGRTFLSDQSLSNSSSQKRSAEGSRIVDVGTGSGSIALALAKELPRAEIHATEISSAALEIARANAARHQLEKRIQFHETDLLAGIEKNYFDFVVSNPPYVGESEEDQVQMEVRKFEPRNAVFAGPTGLEVIERLVPQASGVLKPGGWLVMEISGTIASRVKELLTAWENVRITNDLQGIARVAAAQKP